MYDPSWIAQFLNDDYLARLLASQQSATESLRSIEAEANARLAEQINRRRPPVAPGFLPPDAPGYADIPAWARPTAQEIMAAQVYQSGPPDPARDIPYLQQLYGRQRGQYQQALKTPRPAPSSPPAATEAPDVAIYQSVPAQRPEPPVRVPPASTRWASRSRRDTRLAAREQQPLRTPQENLITEPIPDIEYTPEGMRHLGLKQGLTGQQRAVKAAGMGTEFGPDISLTTLEALDNEVARVSAQIDKMRLADPNLLEEIYKKIEADVDSGKISLEEGVKLINKSEKEVNGYRKSYLKKILGAVKMLPTEEARKAMVDKVIVGRVEGVFGRAAEAADKLLATGVITPEEASAIAGEVEAGQEGVKIPRSSTKDIGMKRSTQNLLAKRGLGQVSVDDFLEQHKVPQGESPGFQEQTPGGHFQHTIRNRDLWKDVLAEVTRRSGVADEHIKQLQRAVSDRPYVATEAIKWLGSKHKLTKSSRYPDPPTGAKGGGFKPTNLSMAQSSLEALEDLISQIKTQRGGPLTEEGVPSYDLPLGVGHGREMHVESLKAAEGKWSQLDRAIKAFQKKYPGAKLPPRPAGGFTRPGVLGALSLIAALAVPAVMAWASRRRDEQQQQPAPPSAWTAG